MDDFCGDNVIGTYLSFVGYCFAIVGLILGGYLALYYSFRYLPAFMKLLQIKAQEEQEAEGEEAEEIPEIHEEQIEGTNANGHDLNENLSEEVGETGAKSTEKNENGINCEECTSSRSTGSGIVRKVELETFKSSTKEHIVPPKV